MRVEQLRGSWVEAVHEVHAAVVDSTGGLVARAGDPELVTFWRSAAKPFQALPLVEGGAAARVGLTSEELGLACAAHSRGAGQGAPGRGTPDAGGVGGKRIAHPACRIPNCRGHAEAPGSDRR